MRPTRPSRSPPQTLTVSLIKPKAEEPQPQPKPEPRPQPPKPVVKPLPPQPDHSAIQIGRRRRDETNAFDTLNQGLEGALGYEIGGDCSVDGNATWMPTAKFNTTKIVGGIDRNGNRLPYAPELNLNVRYAIDKQLSVFGSVRNLTDKKYIASRNPDGIFPGVERNFEVGASYTF